MGGASSRSGERPHVAVVVVHGVGEVVPGEIAAALLHTMDKSPAITADKPLEILRLDDHIPGVREGSEQRRYSAKEPFPAHVHTAKRAAGGRVTFAELYWADLTRVGTGRVNTFLGLIRVLFEAHYLIDAMLNRRGGFFTRVLRFLLLFLSQFLRGPLAALTVCTAVLCWVGINSHHIGLADTHGWLQGVFRGASVELAFIAAMAALALAALGLALWLWHAGDLTWLPMLVCTAICALLVAVGFATSPDGGPIAAATGMSWCYELLILAWRVWGVLFIIALLIALIMAIGSCLLMLLGRLRGSDRRIGAAALTAAGTLALQFLLWSTLSGTVLLPILGRAEEIISLTAINAARDGKTAQQFFHGQGRPAMIHSDNSKAADLYDKVSRLLDVPTLSMRDFAWAERFTYVNSYFAVIMVALLLGFATLVGLRRLAARLAGQRWCFGSWFVPRLLSSIAATAVLLGIVLMALRAIDAARDNEQLLKPADLYNRVDKLLDVPTFFLRDFEWIERFKYIYGYNAVIVIAFLLVFLALIGIRRLVVLLAGQRLRIGSWLMPRLLFNIAATAVLLGFVLVQLVINIILSEDFQGTIRGLLVYGAVNPSTPLGWLFLQTLDVAAAIGVSEATVRDLVIANRYTILGVAAFLSVGLPLLLGNSLNNALHIARDLIDHHYGPREGRAYAAAADIKMSEDERRPRRARIRHRLHELLDRLHERGPIDGVVFVAHSQGSVIVYDYLADPGSQGFQAGKLGKLKPAIVTCGSPLTHLYERYFHEYADLRRNLAKIAPQLSGWRNLYRIDDYIGVHIGRDDRCVANTILECGGHAGYWKEDEIADAVHEAVERVLAHGRVDNVTVAR